MLQNKQEGLVSVQVPATPTRSGSGGGGGAGGGNGPSAIGGMGTPQHQQHTPHHGTPQGQTPTGSLSAALQVGTGGQVGLLPNSIHTGHTSVASSYAMQPSSGANTPIPDHHAVTPLTTPTPTSTSLDHPDLPRRLWDVPTKNRAISLWLSLYPSYLSHKSKTVRKIMGILSVPGMSENKLRQFFIRQIYAYGQSRDMIAKAGRRCDGAKDQSLRIEGDEKGDWKEDQGLRTAVLQKCPYFERMAPVVELENHTSKHGQDKMDDPHHVTTNGTSQGGSAPPLSVGTTTPLGIRDIEGVVVTPAVTPGLTPSLPSAPLTFGPRSSVTPHPSNPSPTPHPQSHFHPSRKRRPSSPTGPPAATSSKKIKPDPLNMPQVQAPSHPSAAAAASAAAIMGMGGHGMGVGVQMGLTNPGFGLGASQPSLHGGMAQGSQQQQTHPQHQQPQQQQPHTQSHLPLPSTPTISRRDAAHELTIKKYEFWTSVVRLKTIQLQCKMLEEARRDPLRDTVRDTMKMVGMEEERLG